MGTFLPVTAWFIYIFFGQIAKVDALIPVECAYNTTQPDKVCCPINPHNHMVCGGPQRGFCQKIFAPQESIPDVFLVDDRLRWPIKFIQYACQCQPRFFGISCERCWFGWKGRDCRQREHKIRKEIRHLSPRELFVFKDVVRRSWTWPSGYLILDESSPLHSDPTIIPRFLDASVQYYITYLHYYGARGTLFNSKELCEEYSFLNYNHDGVVFPTWHRYYNLIWERMLGDIAEEVHGVKDFALPFWDWVGAKTCNICTNKYIGATGSPSEEGIRLHEGSNFYNLTDFCYAKEREAQCSGCQAEGKFGKITRHFKDFDFPDQDDVEFVMNKVEYFVPGERDTDTCDSFHMALEGYCGLSRTASSKLWTHNRIHNMVLGSMEATSTAPNDPMFPLHHSFIDKLFSMWYRVRKPSLSVFPTKDVRPGHSRDAFMIGIFPLARNGDMFTDVNALGYDYEDPDSVGHFAENRRPPVYAQQFL